MGDESEADDLPRTAVPRQAQVEASASDEPPDDGGWLCLWLGARFGF